MPTPLLAAPLLLGYRKLKSLRLKRMKVKLPQLKERRLQNDLLCLY
jgi:hypothetical protein